MLCLRCYPYDYISRALAAIRMRILTHFANYDGVIESLIASETLENAIYSAFAIFSIRVLSNEKCIGDSRLYRAVFTYSLFDMSYIYKAISIARDKRILIYISLFNVFACTRGLKTLKKKKKHGILFLYEVLNVRGELKIAKSRKYSKIRVVRWLFATRMYDKLFEKRYVWNCFSIQTVAFCARLFHRRRRASISGSRLYRNTYYIFVWYFFTMMHTELHTRIQ